MASMNPTRQLGVRGEDVAVRYLEGLGWQLLARNWRCARGEIDIVAFDRAAAALVVCEVKCRSGLGYGDPLEALTYAKVAKLHQLALSWLAASGRHWPIVRLDAIGVVKRRGYAPSISHVRGIQ